MNKEWSKQIGFLKFKSFSLKPVFKSFTIQSNMFFKIQKIPVLNIKPKSIFIYDISCDPKYFPNTCYKTYWDLESYLIAK